MHETSSPAPSSGTLHLPSPQAHLDLTAITALKTVFNELHAELEASTLAYARYRRILEDHASDPRISSSYALRCHDLIYTIKKDGVAMVQELQALRAEWERMDAYTARYHEQSTEELSRFKTEIEDSRQELLSEGDGEFFDEEECYDLEREIKQKGRVMAEMGMEVVEMWDAAQTEYERMAQRFGQVVARCWGLVEYCRGYMAERD